MSTDAGPSTPAATAGPPGPSGQTGQAGQAQVPGGESLGRVVTGRRRVAAPVALAAVAVLVAVLLGLTLDGAASSRFRLAAPDAAVALGTLALPSRATVLVLALLAVAAAVWALLARRARSPVLGAGVAALVAAFLVWAVAGADISLVTLLQGSIVLAVPLVFGAMSGVLCERAGVINIAIEGQLLAGAFASAVTATITGSAWAGMAAAVLAGLAVSWLLAVFAIRYAVDQIVLGVVLNVLVIGVTSFLYGQVLVQDGDRWNSPERLQRIRIPVLADIPVLGPVLFDQTVIVYAMYATVAVLAFALARTRWGLRVRAVGEHPEAADTAGIDVNRVRRRNVLLGGAVAGFGGAFFTLGSVGAFGEEMTAGQGFIALAALIFGRWSPVGALVAALLFGFASNLQSVLSIIATPIPGEVLLMAPYLVTIVAVAGLVGRVRAPAADGVPYRP